MASIESGLRRTLLPLLAVLLLALAAGCNKDDDNGGNGEQNPGTNQVVIQSFAFTPGTVTVPVGTTVSWTNRDSTPHTVTGGAPGSPSGAFNSGNMAPNATFTHTFDTAGSFPYFCMLHPGMTGVVIVQ